VRFFLPWGFFICAKAVKRRKEIWEALHPVKAQRFDGVVDAPVTVKGTLTEAEEREEIQVGKAFPPEIGYGKPPPQTKSFAASTAEASGMTKRSINQHLARAEALGDDLDKVTGTSLDKGVELDALKAMTPAQRAPLIERAQAGEKVTIWEALHPVKAQRFDGVVDAPVTVEGTLTEAEERDETEVAQLAPPQFLASTRWRTPANQVLRIRNRSSHRRKQVTNQPPPCQTVAWRCMALRGVAWPQPRNVLRAESVSSVLKVCPSATLESVTTKKRWRCETFNRSPRPWGFSFVWCWGCIWATCLQIAYKQRERKNPAIF
jgi:hypothetical protein